MASIAKILKKIKANPSGVHFSELQKVCKHYFGESRHSGTSHCIYKTPWPGDPRVNIQNLKSIAKPYQVRQVLLAIEKMELSHGG